MPDFIIPPELIEYLNRGDCVLFVGDALDEAGSQSARLAAALVDACGAHCQFCKPHGKCQCPTSCVIHLTQAAQFYENTPGHNRHSLIEFARSHIGVRAEPTALHRSLAMLPVRVMITTAYDDRLEVALNQQGRAVLPVVRDTDVPFDDPQRTQLIYLHGKLDQADSLVLTEDDAADLWTRLPNVARILGGHFASKTLLFMGYGLSDPNFLALYRQVTGSIQRTQRLAYAVQWPPDPLLVDRWRGKITLLAAEPLAFIHRLTQGLQIKAVEVKRASLPPEPYKFLDFFTRADAEIFFGRDLEADLLLSQILAYPLTVFYGRSGVGKTSLLLARVGPRLDAAGYRVVYARMLGDPSAEVKAAVRGLSIGQLNQIDRGRRLIDVIADALPPGGRVVIVLDQFEEFFLRQGEAVRQAFARELADCLTPTAIDVRLVLSLRDDYLGALDELSSVLPQDVFARRYRLDNLTREKALLAILKPAEAFGLPIDEGLRERLIADLEDQGLETANLQIVVFRLYRDAIVQGLWQPKTRQGVGLTLQRYTALGETRQILAGYLDEVLNELPDEAQRQQVRLILKSMVTPRQTKLAVSGQEIARGDLVGQARLTEAQVTTQLAYLREKRVVRKFGEEDRYELAHEVLVNKVWAWIGDDELRQLEVRDMLRREMSNYQKFRHLLTPEKLALINPGGDSWTLTPEELELLFRSALASGDASAPEWFTRAQASGLPVEAMAREGLRSDNFRARVAAVKMLAQLGAQFIDCISEMLADLYPQVRVAAIHALEKSQPSGEWRKYLKYECYVPAGSFIMGKDRKAHEVNLDAFYIGKYLVTNADYKRYMVVFKLDG